MFTSVWDLIIMVLNRLALAGGAAIFTWLTAKGMIASGSGLTQDTIVAGLSAIGLVIASIVTSLISRKLKINQIPPKV